MSDSPLLQDRCAVVFGAGGSIGAAVARKFAAEGAQVFVAGRTERTLDSVTRQINAAGGRATCTVIDALDDSAVDTYLDGVVAQAGRIDIAFNATGPCITEYGNGKPAVELPVAEFTVAQAVLTSQFITARGAARRMVPQRSGVIIFLTGNPARPHGPGTSGIGAAFGGIEVLMRTMALELAGTGVRVVCLRTAANPDSRTIRETADVLSAMMHVTRAQMLASLDAGTLLKASPQTEDTANGAVLLASDLARMMTGTVHNATAGICTDQGADGLHEPRGVGRRGSHPGMGTRGARASGASSRCRIGCSAAAPASADGELPWAPRMDREHVRRYGCMGCR